MASWSRRAVDPDRLRRQIAPIANLGLQRWPVEKTRPVRNVLIMLVLFGPILGLGVAVTSIPAGPTDQVLTADDGPEVDPDRVPGPDEIGARITLLNPDLSRGELTARVVIEPGADLTADDGTLTRTIRVIVPSDIAGRTQTVFETGSTVDPITASLQLSGSRLTRYPVDTYLAEFVLAVQREVDPGEGNALSSEPQFEAIPIVATVQSSLSDLRVSGSLGAESSSRVLFAEFDLERPRSVMAFAVALMALAWLLAAGCMALAWGILVRASEIPVWCWGFYAGVLFALPQLRNGLPGSPPFGSVIDWAAYYWALGGVGVSLLALILAGNVAIRATVSARGRTVTTGPPPERGAEVGDQATVTEDRAEAEPTPGSGLGLP